MKIIRKEADCGQKFSLAKSPCQNFDGSRIHNTNALGCVVRDSSCIIKMVARRHVDDSSITVAKCMALRDRILVAKNNGFLYLEIEGDSKIVVDSYNRKISIPISIILLMEDI